MKASTASCPVTFRGLVGSVLPSRACWAMALAWLGAGLALPASGLGESPSFQWFGSVYGRLFAVDEQTNLYVNASGPVVKLTASGAIIQSNNICPIGGRAQRDAAGNYYFADTYSPPRDFGGTTLTNGNMFIAKYNSAGALQWARSFGPSFVSSIGLGDLVVEPGGIAYAGSTYCYGSSCSSAYAELDVYNSDGSVRWMQSQAVAEHATHSFRLGIATPSNVCSLVFNSAQVYTSWSSVFMRWGAGATYFDYLTQPFYGTVASSYGRPIQNAAGEMYMVENYIDVNFANALVKRSPDGQVLWRVVLDDVSSYTVGEDYYGGVHVANAAGKLRRYDSDGTLVWELNFGSPVAAMLVDASGNRFLSSAGGSVGRLGSEALSSPQIVTPPSGLTVFSGSNATVSVAVSGSGPLRYSWFKDNVAVANATNASLSLPNAQSSQSGSYSVVISNFLGSVTSAPVSVRIKAVQLFLGGQMLTNGNYTFVDPPAISVLSAFSNGSIFYTLDGSAPTFLSPTYSGPFAVSNNATIRALGYSSDFLQSEEADPVSLVFPPKYHVTAGTVGPGTIALSPTGGVYLASNLVHVTAAAAPGWTFLYWTGDATGTSPTTDLVMDGDKNVQAVFGTSLATSPAAHGQIQVFPAFAVYPYGTIVRLTPVPDPGYYFGIWGNAASGSANPLLFTITNANPTVSALFAALPAGQSALTVLINGPGVVGASPTGNLFATNVTVQLTATPNAGQGFVGWGGDASGPANPISLAMTQSRMVTAIFTNWPVLLANRQSLTPTGFVFQVVSGPGQAYQIQGSTDLNAWTGLGVISNVTGVTPFVDSTSTNFARRYYRGVPAQ